MAILVVDDDDTILALVEAFLNRKGYKVTKANNAFMALKMLDTVTPDLFVLDIMMPHLNGIELCRRLRDADKTTDTPILVLSAMSDKETIQKCLDAGASAYLCKSDLLNLPSVVYQLLQAAPARAGWSDRAQ